jgi:hypothetical protein
MKASTKVGIGIAGAVLATGAALMLISVSPASESKPESTETARPVSSVESGPASILSDSRASGDVEQEVPKISLSGGAWPPVLDPVGPTKPPVVASAGAWQVVSTRSMLGLPAADLGTHATFGLQIRGAEPGSPVVEFSLNRREWVPLPALGAGHWTARRPFRTWQIDLPRSSATASKLLPLWIRIQGLPGEVLTALRF